MIHSEGLDLNRFAGEPMNHSSDPDVVDAWPSPLICAVILLAIAIPAASSDARLIRSPVDNFSIEFDRL